MYLPVYFTFGEFKNAILNTRPDMSDVSNQEEQALQNDLSKEDSFLKGR